MQILKRIAFSTTEEGSGSLGLAYRSIGATVNTGNLCSSETTSLPIYIYGNTRPIVTTGDIAYNTNNQSSPFDGEDKYYKVAYNGFAGDSYIVQINSFGEITVNEYCII